MSQGGLEIGCDVLFYCIDVDGGGNAGIAPDVRQGCVQSVDKSLCTLFSRECFNAELCKVGLFYSEFDAEYDRNEGFHISIT